LFLCFGVGGVAKELLSPPLGSLVFFRLVVVFIIGLRRGSPPPPVQIEQPAGDGGEDQDYYDSSDGAS
jgi:hypothetical protein